MSTSTFYVVLTVEVAVIAFCYVVGLFRGR